MSGIILGLSLMQSSVQIDILYLCIPINAVYYQEGKHTALIPIQESNMILGHTHTTQLYNQNHSLINYRKSKLKNLLQSISLYVWCCYPLGNTLNIYKKETQAPNIDS